VLVGIVTGLTASGLYSQTKTYTGN
jgi:hypothetical protein